MGIGKRIKEAREQAGLTQEELGKLIGVTGSAITNYEKETSHPKEPVMYALINALGVDANFLFQDCVKTKKAPPYSSEALKLARDYDGLDAYGKKAVRGVADIEMARCDDAAASERGVIELFPVRKYLQSASAGYGDFNDDDSYEMIDLIKRPPLGTSFIVSVNGDSMEPTYHDGDLLFVRAQETIQVGEIGLFVKAGHLYVKEAGKDGLISHNSKKYPIIYAEEDSPIITEGRILGICTPDYLL